MPILSRAYEVDPSQWDMAALFRRAVRASRPPRHFISDKGPQFTGEVFRALLQKLGVRQRFGKIGKVQSISLMERFWKTLKEALRLPLGRPLVYLDLNRQLRAALTHYAYHRSHSGLNGATPAERYFNLEPAHDLAVHPPRGRPGDPAAEPSFRIEQLDPDGRFPILVRAA